MELLIDYHRLKLGKYGMPTWDGLCYPTLLYLQDRQIRTGLEIRHAVADSIGLPAQLRQKSYDNSKQTTKVIEDRVGWACSDMFIAKMLQRPERGHYQITHLGLHLLKQYGIKINRQIVHRQPAYSQHRQAVISQKQANVQEITSVDNVTDIDQMVQELNNQVATELLTLILNNAPNFFESLVVELLSKMGYKGKNGSSKVTSISNDGGIDGIINQDPLGTRTIYLQAKRYSQNNIVGRPEIQKFHGALDEKNADRGVFITTSDFSQGAQNAAEKLGIILVNGQMLANLMIKYSVGVRVKNQFMIYDIDRDYFE
ncbi:restriction endonuclease [Bombilactobacillus bombi]|uniref:restriction endonuclease n=1 Tax=Bombilactobacillus bombi TaxID=1303590 RepID=UPI0015E5CDC8|nr:restriction endonuclease [Bombilactobacillus bombi]MBA1433671.1 restriction endonuclease [Bombilactobacillus bombi]